MSTILKTPKKKLSISIDEKNFNKIQNIKKLYQENRSSIINTCLDLSLEEVEKLLNNPLEIEEELLKKKLEDLKRLKQEKKKRTSRLFDEGLSHNLKLQDLEEHELSQLKERIS